MHPAVSMTEGSFGRREDLRVITGTGRYVADIACEGMVHAFVIRSAHAHARILSIDVAAATAMPRVVGVFTAADLAADDVRALTEPVSVRLGDGGMPPLIDRPVLAANTVGMSARALCLS
ncbi:hypothetical protein [Marinivivus vitaminiproducens]|uniref:hypothetical protein n=1 Tax=Marinivivus vitaminiproducens TaxID=3035935 RepID=UPI003FA0ECDA